MKNKKSVMNEIVSVAVLVLVVSVLFGLTFLFTNELKETTRNTVDTSFTVTNESGGYINATGYTLGIVSTDSIARSFAIVTAYNNTDGSIIGSGNYTLSDTGIITNATVTNWADVNVTYTYLSASGSVAYQAVNDTETAGATIVDYLPLVFLSLIFGAILVLVLRIIVPYLNLGRNMGTSF